MSARNTERERDLQRVEKNGTSRNASGAPEHSARSLIGRALMLFSRAQMLRERAEEQSYVKSARANMLLERVRIPVCFVRRCGAIDDACDDTALYEATGTTVCFDGRSKSTARPLLAQTNMLVDCAPPDLHAALYEVRYLTLFEVALLATRSVARAHLKDVSIAAMRTVRQTREGDTPHLSATIFDNAVDVAYEAKTEANQAVQRDFAHALEHLRVPQVHRPFEHRLPLVTRAQEILERNNFQQPACRVFVVDVEQHAQSDSKTKQSHANAAREDAFESEESVEQQRRRYNEKIQFRLRYLHLQSIASGHVGKTRSVQIPARLFAKAFDDPNARKMSSTDVGEVDRVLRKRLARALERFGQPVRDNEALLELFGDAPCLKRFEALLQWRARELAHASNYRSAAHVILGALHRFMDDIERCTFDDAEFERTFAVETRAWDCWRGSAHKRQHAQLFSFVSGTDTAHNDWQHDGGRPASQRGATQMMAPEDIAARFYQKHWVDELRSEAQAQFVLNSGAQDDNARRFWRTWNADSHRAAHSGSTPTQPVLSRSVTLSTMLAFEADPLDCSDPSARNDYGSIFQQQQRQLASYNPFVRFANSVFNYVSSQSRASRWQQHENDADASIYVESTLASHLIKNCLGHIDQALSAEEDSADNAPLPALPAGSLRDRWCEAVHQIRSPRASSGGNWADVQHALRLNASAAVNDFVSAWGAVEHIMQRAAMFDRSAAALTTPFSTLYDFGVHALRCSEGENAKKERLLYGNAEVSVPRSLSPRARAIAKVALPAPHTDHCVREQTLVATKQKSTAGTATNKDENDAVQEERKCAANPASQSLPSTRRGWAYEVKKPSVAKFFADIGVASKRKKRRAATNAAGGAEEKKIRTTGLDTNTMIDASGMKSSRARHQPDRLCM